MKNNEEKEITNEVRRVRATPYRTSRRAYCPMCGKPVELLGFSEAVDFFKTDFQAINGLVERGELHRLHNRKGLVMICADSVFRLLTTTKDDV
jgi:hypothetical protein